MESVGTLRSLGMLSPQELCLMGHLNSYLPVR